MISAPNLLLMSIPVPFARQILAIKSLKDTEFLGSSSRKCRKSGSFGYIFPPFPLFAGFQTVQTYRKKCRSARKRHAAGENLQSKEGEREYCIHRCTHRITQVHSQTLQHFLLEEELSLPDARDDSHITLLLPGPTDALFTSCFSKELQPL